MIESLHAKCMNASRWEPDNHPPAKLKAHRSVCRGLLKKVDMRLAELEKEQHRLHEERTRLLRMISRIVSIVGE